MNLENCSLLTDHGLNLTAVLDTALLPDDIQQQLGDLGLDLADYRRLVLLGNGGSSFWDALQAADVDSANPVDDFSTAIATRLIQEQLGGAPSHILYPGPALISLIRLGQLAGWSHPSPLGLGINAEYGLWFAYRVAFVTAADLTPTTPAPTPHPCGSCVDKPCISACPVGAVSADEPFAIATCYEFRVSENSPCADRCLSRLVCPIGQQHQYPLPQIQHHYELTRSMGGEWKNVARG